MRPAPVLRWPGSKWSVARWIVNLIPEHVHYVEPFFGSGAVYFSKLPSKFETINDIDGNVVNLFRVIRTRAPELAALIEMTPWARDEFCLSHERTGNPLEDARLFLIRTWQAIGAKTSSLAGWRTDVQYLANSSRTTTWNNLPERILAIAGRLKDAQIENRPALEIIERHRFENALLYIDPAYPLQVRTGGRQYAHEMTDGQHAELLDMLVKHPGPVMISGYACALYDERLAGWGRFTHKSFAEGGRQRIEVLWLNRVAMDSGNIFSVRRGD